MVLGTECGLGESNAFVTMGWYVNVVAVDPTSPERLWAAGVDLFRSEDGGRTWGPASYWWAGRTTPAFAHADQHPIVFHPGWDGGSNQTLFLANDGGEIFEPAQEGLDRSGALFITSLRTLWPVSRATASTAAWCCTRERWPCPSATGCMRCPSRGCGGAASRFPIPP